MSSIADRERKLKASLEEQKTRENINNSKFRAVAQHMDYQGFRQMVLGANLKPTKAGSIFSMGSKSQKTPTRQQRKYQLGERMEEHSLRGRYFHAQGPFEKIKILEESDSEEFKRFVDFEIFGDILKQLTDVIENDQCDSDIFQVLLERLTGLENYNQLTRFLSRKEKATLQSLISTQSQSNKNFN